MESDSSDQVPIRQFKGNFKIPPPQFLKRSLHRLERFCVFKRAQLHDVQMENYRHENRRHANVPTLSGNISRVGRLNDDEDGGEAVCSLWKTGVSGLSGLEVLRLHSCYFTELFDVSLWALHLTPTNGDHLGTWFTKYNNRTLRLSS